MEGIIEGCGTTLFAIYFEGQCKYDWKECVGKDFILFGKLLRSWERDTFYLINILNYDWYIFTFDF